MQSELDAVKANLFPSSHAAIDDWNMFPWHRHQGKIQTHKPESSQALAIDVFGTIKVSNDRHRILAAIGRRCGLADDGNWEIDLEWSDPDNRLKETSHRTQVDAIAFGRHAILVIECKFTETGGGCSQPIPIAKGPNAGQRQCNGDYAMQVNSVKGIEARCALSGKEIRYWDTIPKIYGLDSNRDYRPCPFKGDAYQWMRNVVLADWLAETRGKSAAVIAAYADAESLPTAKKVRSGVLGHAAASGRPLITPISYQSIIALARSLSDHPETWGELGRWVNRKIQAATGLSQR